MTVDRFGTFGIAVLALAALLNIATLYTAQGGFEAVRDAANWVRHTQDAENLVEHVYRKIVDAETGQRGYLLTQDALYLPPYVDARTEIPKDLAALGVLTQDNPVQVAQMATVRKLLDTRLAEMEASLTLKRDRGDEALRDYLKSHQGMMTMSALRLALDGMAAEERSQYERRIRTFAYNQNLVRVGFLLVVGLNLFLITLGGIFLSQEARRRRREAVEASERNVQLARAVQDRTAELTGLSHYLQRVQEEEKAKVAREIHDEMGGTLAAAKIDLQLVSDKLAGGDQQRARLTRIMAAIDDTIQVKRRIIEDLRPTLLDHLGLGPALKWQCSQFTQRSGVPCRVDLQEEGLSLSPAYSIALYRIVQEALTNITKYAKAKNVAVSLKQHGDQWLLRIADDGIGIDLAKRHNPTAHGLVSMRERTNALGGEFSIQGKAGRGTVVEIRVPVEKKLP
ncbi:MAG: CHASE3 domain-containing protein [Burkholderiales bacterium]